MERQNGARSAMAEVVRVLGEWVPWRAGGMEGMRHYQVVSFAQTRWVPMYEPLTGAGHGTVTGYCIHDGCWMAPRHTKAAAEHCIAQHCQGTHSTACRIAQRAHQPLILRACPPDVAVVDVAQKHRPRRHQHQRGRRRPQLAPQPPALRHAQHLAHGGHALYE